MDSVVHDDKCQVLVVDDDKDICEIVSRMLVRLGHEPVTVISGESAVNEFAKGGFDLVLLDIDMPQMSGEDVYAALRQNAEDLPVLFMSGYRTEELASCLKDDDAVGFLAKPFPMAELRTTVDSMLSGAMS